MSKAWGYFSRLSQDPIVRSQVILILEDIADQIMDTH